MFDLYECVPLEGDPHAAPPATLPPGWRERFQARQRVGKCLIPHAALAPKVGPRAPHWRQPPLKPVCHARRTCAHVARARPARNAPAGTCGQCMLLLSGALRASAERKRCVDMREKALPGIRQAMAPHLTAFAARVDELWAGREVWLGERCLMSDVIMLAAAKAGDPGLQNQARFTGSGAVQTSVVVRVGRCSSPFIYVTVPAACPVRQAAAAWCTP
jgi:hypothetical protein